MLTLNATPDVVELAVNVSVLLVHVAVNSASDAFDITFAYSVMYTSPEPLTATRTSVTSISPEPFFA